MTKKKWALLLLAAILAFGYIKLFYKTVDEKAVPQSADCIVVVDVKRITNTLIWNYITTPSQWKGGKLFSKKSDTVSWDDMIELPDYMLAFHTKGQPANAWYMLLTIKNKTDFEKGLKQYDFNQYYVNKYSNKSSGINLFVQGDKVLVSTVSLLMNSDADNVIEEIFLKKNFAQRATLNKAINLSSHLAIYQTPNDFLQKEATLTANFDKYKIEITANCTPKAEYIFKENIFNYAETELCTAGFTQPSASFYNLFDLKSKAQLSKAFNIELDSLLQPQNQYYLLNLAEIKTRADSAVTYTYDDEFNKVEKVVVNNIQEPAFNFIVAGNSAGAFYNYLHATNKLEATAAGELFLPMPLVKSYCTLNSNEQLAITSSNYTPIAAEKSIHAIFFLNLSLNKFPKNLQKYLPAEIVKAFSNIAAVKLSAIKNNGDVVLSAVFEKQQNEQPIIKL